MLLKILELGYEQHHTILEWDPFHNSSIEGHHYWHENNYGDHIYILSNIFFCYLPFSTSLRVCECGNSLFYEENSSFLVSVLEPKPLPENQRPDPLSLPQALPRGFCNTSFILSMENCFSITIKKLETTKKLNNYLIITFFLKFFATRSSPMGRWNPIGLQNFYFLFDICRVVKEPKII